MTPTNPIQDIIDRIANLDPDIRGWALAALTDREELLRTLAHAVQMLEDIQRGKSFPALEYVNRVRIMRETLDSAIAADHAAQSVRS